MPAGREGGGQGYFTVIALAANPSSLTTTLGAFLLLLFGAPISILHHQPLSTQDLLFDLHIPEPSPTCNRPGNRALRSLPYILPTQSVEYMYREPRRLTHTSSRIATHAPCRPVVHPSQHPPLTSPCQLPLTRMPSLHRLPMP